jgi:hypothetical protein
MGCSKGLSTDEPVVSHSVIGGIPIYSGRHTQSDENTEVAATIPRSITPAAAHLVDRTRRHIALRLLPFLFILYITNYLDRTSVAYAAIGMSRDLGFSDRVIWTGSRNFLRQLRGLAGSGGLAGGMLERATDDFCDHDHVGIADGTDRTGAYSDAALPGTLYVGERRRPGFSRGS